MSTLPSHTTVLPDQFMGSEEAVAGLLDMRYGTEGGSLRRSPNAQLLRSRRIGNISVTFDQVHELFQQYVVSFCHKPSVSNTFSKLLFFLPSLPPNP